jgi:hypothetical protein
VDGDLTDVFAAQDKLTERVIQTIAPNICGAEIRLVAPETPSWITEEELRGRDNRSASPTDARFLLDLLLPKADREQIAGDREEEFRRMLAEYGPGRARLWFWSETVRTIATRNPICRWILVRLEL